MRPHHWHVTASSNAMRTRNFIREIVDTIALPADPPQPVIPLSLGDPAVYGNLPPPEGLADEVARVVREGKCNGYCNALGLPEARAAVARSLSFSHVVTPDDVAITCGCSHALLVAVAALCDQGSNLLVPAPAFPLYRTLCAFLSVEVRMYRLLPEQNWEADLKHVEQLCDDKTAAILVNNPSNPCGSNWSKHHILDILGLCERLHLPIITDEVYANMVFKGEAFHSFAELSQNVPVMVCGGTAKQFMIPGWRVGWIVLHDRHHIFKEAKMHTAVAKLMQLILGASTITQAVVPYLLERVPPTYLERSMNILQENANAFCSVVAAVKGLTVVRPQGAMYCMVSFDVAEFPSFTTDVEFAQALLRDQQVFVLPGSCFMMPFYFRVVLCAPADVLADAARRIVAFCTQNRL